MPHVISKKKLLPYAYQPIMELGSNRVYCHEALMRPKSSDPNTYIRRHRLPNGKIDTHTIEYNTLFSALHFARGLEGKIFVNSFPNEVLTEQELDGLVGLYGEQIFS